MGPLFSIYKGEIVCIPELNSRFWGWFNFHRDSLKILISASFFDLFIVKPVLSGHLKTEKTKVLKTNGNLMKVESIAESSPWSTLQYFWPALSDIWFWKPILVFFLSDRLRQVLLYSSFKDKMTIKSWNYFLGILHSSR